MTHDDAGASAIEVGSDLHSVGMGVWQAGGAGKAPELSFQ